MINHKQAMKVKIMINALRQTLTGAEKASYAEAFAKACFDYETIPAFPLSRVLTYLEMGVSPNIPSSPERLTPFGSSICGSAPLDLIELLLQFKADPKQLLMPHAPNAKHTALSYAKERLLNTILEYRHRDKGDYDTAVVFLLGRYETGTGKATS